MPTLARSSSRDVIEAAAAALQAELGEDFSKLSSKKRASDVEKAQCQLEEACLNNDIKTARQCYLRGASLSAALPSGAFPLHIAVQKRNFAFVEFLRKYDVDMNITDRKGRTALHMAAANNDDEGIPCLIEGGAKHELQDYKGRTALHKAASAGHTNVVELLSDLGADINATDKAGWTAVSHAEFNNHFALADRLVQRGASDPCDMRNETKHTSWQQKK